MVFGRLPKLWEKVIISPKTWFMIEDLKKRDETLTLLEGLVVEGEDRTGLVEGWETPPPDLIAMMDQMSFPSPIKV
jgi:hypothetical protein